MQYVNKISGAAFPLCPRTGTASPKGDGNKWGEEFIYGGKSRSMDN